MLAGRALNPTGCLGALMKLERFCGLHPYDFKMAPKSKANCYILKHQIEQASRNKHLTAATRLIWTESCYAPGSRDWRWDLSRDHNARDSRLKFL